MPIKISKSRLFSAGHTLVRDVDSANYLLEQGELLLAEESYTHLLSHEHLTVNDTAILLHNRALAAYRRLAFAAALADCQAAMTLRPPRSMRQALDLLTAHIRVGMKDRDGAAELYVRCGAERRAAILANLPPTTSQAPTQNDDMSSEPGIVAIDDEDESGLELAAVEEAGEGEAEAGARLRTRARRASSLLRAGERSWALRQFPPEHLDTLANNALSALSPSYDTLNKLLTTATTFLANEPNVIDIQAARLIAIGDLHGSLPDLRAALAAAGVLREDVLYAPTCHLVFLGDYVDRGANGRHILQFICAYKLRYPDLVHTLRGNHEAPALCAQFGFKDEVFRAGNANGNDLLQIKTEYNKYISLFRALPIALRANYRVLCTHGGIPAEREHILADLTSADRTRTLTTGSPIMPYLWADPRDNELLPKRAGSEAMHLTFSKEAARNWLSGQGLSQLVRAHQPVSAGFANHWGANLVYTVFSVAMYGGRTNSAAVAELVFAAPGGGLVEVSPITWKYEIY